MRLIITLYLLLSAYNSIAQTLSGTYSVGSGKNYTSINAAVTALESKGVSGPVVFEIASALTPYYERISISEITGASAINTITFTSASKNPNDVVVFGITQNSDDHHIWQLDGANYIILDKITIQNMSKSFGSVVHLINEANNITIRNCRIVMDSTSETAATFDLQSNGEEVNTFVGGIVATGPVPALSYVMYQQGNNCNNLRIENNEIIGGTMGILLWGNGPKIKNNSILNNRIINTTRHGIWALNNDSLTVIGNTIFMHKIGHPLSRSVSIRESQHVNFSKNIVANIVYMGVYFEYSDGLISNNMVFSSLTRNFTDEASSYVDLHGMYLKNGILDVYHNTINIQDLEGVSNVANEALYIENGTGLYNVKNNILVNGHKGYAFYSDNRNNEGRGIINQDFNNYFSNGPNLAAWGGTAVTDFSTWKSVTGQDAHSKNINVVFTSVADLHTNDIAMDFSGTYLEDITEDIDGQARNKAAPDMGADEFVLFEVDLGLEFVGPSLAWLNEEYIPLVRLGNHGNSDISTNQVTIHLSIDSGKTYTYSELVNLSNLSSLNDTLNHTFSTAIRLLTEQGKHWLSAAIGPKMGGDNNQKNDTIYASYCVALKDTLLRVGGAESDFLSIQDAFNFINNSCAINGEIILEIEDGTYEETLLLSAFNPLSESSKITIRSKSKNKSAVVIKTILDSTSLAFSSLQLNGVQNVYFEHLSFILESSRDSSMLVYLKAPCSNISFNNCKFQSLQAKNKSFGIVSGERNANRTISGSFIRNLNIDSCEFIDLGTGIALIGTTQNAGYSIQINKNNFQNISEKGIYSKLNNVSKIEQNRFTLLSDSAIAMDVESAVTDFKINRNFINSGLIGIQIKTSSGITGAIVSNNMIGKLTKEMATGIRADDSDKIYFYNNTIHVGADAFAAVHITEVFEMDIRNNVFINNGDNYAAYIEDAVNIKEIDNNVYYSRGSVLAYWDENCASLSILSSINGGEQNSLELLPKFQTDQLHTLDSNLDGKAVFIVGINKDFDGTLRDTIKPDIGADEFTLGLDASIQIMSPTVLDVEESGKYLIIAEIFNEGSVEINDFRITGSINGNLLYDSIYSGNPISTSSSVFWSLDSMTIKKGFVNEVCVQITATNDVKESNNKDCESYSINTSIQSKTSNVILYPNPVQDIFYIQSTENISSITIYNSIGKEIKFIKNFNEEGPVSTNNMMSGWYTVLVEFENKESQFLKFIK